MPPRILPQDPDAEQWCLGAALQSPTALEHILVQLQPEHFLTIDNRSVFTAMTGIASRDEGVDVVTIIRELDATHAFDGNPAWHGGVESAKARMVGYLSTLIMTTTHTGNVKRHAQIVKDMWGKRRLIEVFTPPMNGVWNGSRPDAVIREVERSLMAARTEIEDEGESRVISSLDAAKWMDERIKNPPSSLGGVPTPWGPWLPRFRPGWLVVLGGYPKDGKTASSVQFLHDPIEEGVPIGYFSVEMSWEQLTERFVSTHGVPYNALQQGYVAPQFQHAFEKSLEHLAKARLDIIDDAAISASEIARQVKIGRYKYIVVDYLQRMPFVDRLDLNKQVKELATLARKAEIPILLLSQLTWSQHATQTNPFPRPQMSQFAETSAIVKEAAMATAIWRKRDEFGSPTSEAEFLVLASRFTEPTAKRMHFRADEQRFVEVAHDRS